MSRIKNYMKTIRNHSFIESKLEKSKYFIVEQQNNTCLSFHKKPVFIETSNETFFVIKRYEYSIQKARIGG